jgi:cilia- and flagella-associated protein 52
MVRVWSIKNDSQTLEQTMKEHKNAVSQIRINKEDTQCLTASWDGTCIIWDLKYINNLIILLTNSAM